MREDRLERQPMSEVTFFKYLFWFFNEIMQIRVHYARDEDGDKRFYFDSDDVHRFFETPFYQDFQRIILDRRSEWTYIEEANAYFQEIDEVLSDLEGGTGEYLYLYRFTEDYPGFARRVKRELANRGINVRNIGLPPQYDATFSGQRQRQDLQIY